MAVELSIQGTYTGPFPTPDGVVQPAGARLDIPTADSWCIEDGKIRDFDCYVGLNIMLGQHGVQPDVAGAVNAPAAA